MPAASVYSVFTGAYIRHELPRYVKRHVYAAPTYEYPDGHDVLPIIIYCLFMAIVPEGHDVDGAAANDAHGTIAKNNIIFFIFNYPFLIRKTI